MRQIPEDFHARLLSGVTTLAHAWRIRRRDGVVVGFTDHDGDLALDGLVHRAASAVAGEHARMVLGGEERAEIMGVLEDDAFSAATIEAGLWDGARVDLWRVDWSDPARRVHLWAGTVGAVTRQGDGFTAHVEGLDAPFDRPIGRVLSRFCDAEVGDGRCGVTLSAPMYCGSGHVARVTGARIFAAGGLDAFEDGWFTQGLLVWASGARSIVAAHRRTGDSVTLELLEPTAAAAPAAPFTVTAGCDKRFGTCRSKFANGASFRGFPHMPGTETMLAGPDQNEPRDGGSRFR